MKKSEINFKISLDENHIPEEIAWASSDGQGMGKSKSLLISIWDAEENNTLKIDLWTKEMTVEEMKKFFHQTFLSLADTFERATGEDKMAGDLRDFCGYFAEKMHLIASPGNEKK